MYKQLAAISMKKNHKFYTDESYPDDEYDAFLCTYFMIIRLELWVEDVYPFIDSNRVENI